jgi:hypothetical protein
VARAEDVDLADACRAARRRGERRRAWRRRLDLLFGIRRTLRLSNFVFFAIATNYRLDERAKLIPSVEVSTNSKSSVEAAVSAAKFLKKQAGDTPAATGSAADAILSRRALGVFDYFTDCGREFIHARARHDDGVAPAMRFLGDAQESAPFVLAELDVKMLAFDL